MMALVYTVLIWLDFSWERLGCAIVKIYLFAFFIVLGINAVDLVLMHLLGMEAYSSIGQTSFFVAWAVLTGLLGNYFYFSHSVKNIKKVMSNTADPATVEQELAAKGGASRVRRHCG